MPTQFIKKMNKTEAGFHLLMSLSMADGSVHKSEASVLIDFLNRNFNDNLDLIKEQAFFKAYPQEGLFDHFIEVAEQFYILSSPEDRNKLITFAMKLVMADSKMEPTENKYINALYDAWGLE
jgi:uncharacterized tellurite resistance protein B-like protein